MTADDQMLARERIANRPKHWVRAVTACNSRCLFCLDSDTPRNVYLPKEEVEAELRRGIETLGADKVILSGGEASLHPNFADFVRYAKEIGYDRVQTVTNGYRFAEREFYVEARDAGLGEITFSLHGHTAELHDELTGRSGAFLRLMKGMVRALRDPRGPIVNVDVVICKKNVAVLDKIVELAISVGVTEFDLLHVIPQAAAFDNRDELFYDPRDHLETLHKVFRLNRHPRFVIWTNRFPVSYLEGLEDLVQDPHKMLDEVNGRRWQVRRYLDVGKPLDCRQPERCVHCFIEPFCTTQDRVIARLQSGRYAVWSVEDPGAPLPEGKLPFGCELLGVQLGEPAELRDVAVPSGAGQYARVDRPGPLPDLGVPLVLVADTDAHLDAWLDGPVAIDVMLNRQTGPWLLANRDRVAAASGRIRIHQPSYEHLEGTRGNDVRDPAAFFRTLGLRVRVSGLPACLAPGTELVEARPILHAAMFEPETGRLDIRELARHHVREGYFARSERCRGCRLASRCDGAHVNLLRDQGLKQLEPLVDGAWAEDAEAQLIARWPEPPARVRDGRAPERPHPSVPGFAQPESAPMDPLAVIAAKLQARREARKALAGAD